MSDLDPGGGQHREPSARRASATTTDEMPEGQAEGSAPAQGRGEPSKGAPAKVVTATTREQHGAIPQVILSRASTSHDLPLCFTLLFPLSTPAPRSTQHPTPRRNARRVHAGRWASYSVYSPGKAHANLSVKAPFRHDHSVPAYCPEGT